MTSFRSLLAFCLAGVTALVVAVAPAVAQAPTILSFRPTSAGVEDTILVFGDNLDRDGSGAVWTGAVPYRVAFAAATGRIEVVPVVVNRAGTRYLQVVVPRGAVSGALALTQSSRKVSDASRDTFRVIPRPRIDFVNPSSSGVGGTVGLFGANFKRDVAGNLWTGPVPYRVRFPRLQGSVEAVPTVLSDTEIRVVVPAGAVPGRPSLVQSGIVLTTCPTNLIINPTRLRIVNQTQYDMVSLVVDGIQQFAPGTGILVGNSGDMLVQPGQHTIVVGIGGADANGNPEVWFGFQRTVNVAAGETSIQTFAPVSLGFLMTRGAPTRDWLGTYTDANGAPHSALLRFTSSGAWSLFDDGVFVGSGFASLSSWPARALEIRFRLVAGGPEAVMAFPFGSFFLRNGPPSQPIIQYLMQQ